MTEQELINQFGKEERYKGNYSDFIDQDQLARNDFFHYKKGYELGIKQLETTKKQLWLYKEETDCLGRIFKDYEMQGLSSMTIEYLSARISILKDDLAKLSKEGRMRRKLLDADDLINPGDIFKTNRTYQGERKEDLILIELSEDVFINHEKTYLMKSTKDDKRFYMGRSWVSKVKPTIKHKE